MSSPVVVNPSLQLSDQTPEQTSKPRSKKASESSAKAAKPSKKPRKTAGNSSDVPTQAVEDAFLFAQTEPEDARFTERLGAGYPLWIATELTKFLFGTMNKKTSNRSYTWEECLSQAQFISTEYVLDPARRGRSLRDFFPQSAAEIKRVRDYVARVSLNDMLRRLRAEDSPTGVHTPHFRSVKSQQSKDAALRASAFAGVHSLSFEDEDIGATESMEMLGLDDVDPQFHAGTVSMNPAELFELQQSANSWSELAVDFVDALHEGYDFVKHHPDLAVARRDRLLFSDGRVNSAYLLVRALHEIDHRQSLRIAPAMSVRWMYNQNTPQRVLALLGDTTCGRSLADIYESEARSLVSWARAHTKLTNSLRDAELRQVVADARESVDRWRGEYGAEKRRGA